MRKVLYAVLSAHLLFLVYIHLSFSPETKVARKPLIVKTLSAHASSKEKSAPSRAPSTAQKKTVQPAKKAEKPPAKAPAPLAKKKSPPIADKKLVKEKKKAPPTPPKDDQRAKMSQKLLQDLEESLSKLEAKPEKKKSPSTKLGLPDPIISLHADRPSSSIESIESNDYHSTLIG